MLMFFLAGLLPQSSSLSFCYSSPSPNFGICLHLRHHHLCRFPFLSLFGVFFLTFVFVYKFYRDGIHKINNIHPKTQNNLWLSPKKNLFFLLLVSNIHFEHTHTRTSLCRIFVEFIRISFVSACCLLLHFFFFLFLRMNELFFVKFNQIFASPSLASSSSSSGI